MKRLFLIATFVCIHAAAVAQEQTMRVNNLVVCRMYDTQEQIFEAIGEQPDSIVPPQPSNECPNTYLFYFGDDYVEWAEGELYSIRLYTPRFAFNDKIRVGDNISKLAELGGTLENVKNGLTMWYPDTHIEGLQTCFYYDETGKITIILAMINEL